MSWQSYNIILCKLWQLIRCSRDASVIRGQLSNSSTAKCSEAHVEVLRCLMPSSVISSQCDKLCYWKYEFKLKLLEDK